MAHPPAAFTGQPQPQSAITMFKSDLFRSFAIGFVLGAVAICLFLSAHGGIANPVVASAIAAPSR